MTIISQMISKHISTNGFFFTLYTLKYYPRTVLYILVLSIAFYFKSLIDRLLLVCGNFFYNLLCVVNNILLLKNHLFFSLKAGNVFSFFTILHIVAPVELLQIRSSSNPLRYAFR